MKQVFLIRHGSTLGNEQLTHQTAKTPLSEKGLEQARLLGERFKNLPADIILASSMTRAQQTANEIAKTTGLSIVSSDLLVESASPSVLHEKSHADEESKNIMGEIFRNFADKTFRHSDEETFWDLEARAKEALALILERKEEKIIVVTHGLVLKMMFGVMIFGDTLSPEMFARFRHSLRNSNTGITICEYEPERVPDIDHAYTGWRCLTFNDHAHLG